MYKTTYRFFLLQDIEKVHTTELGLVRIKKNLGLGDIDVIKYIKELINKPDSKVIRKGKNLFVDIDNITITINMYNYCVITAHKK